MVWRGEDGGVGRSRPEWWLPREAALELAALMAEEPAEEEEGDQ